jgi:hypothetical protein
VQIVQMQNVGSPGKHVKEVFRFRILHRLSARAVVRLTAWHRKPVQNVRKPEVAPYGKGPGLIRKAAQEAAAPPGTKRFPQKQRLLPWNGVPSDNAGDLVTHCRLPGPEDPNKGLSAPAIQERIDVSDLQVAKST